jgi:hypothetical protein
MSIPLPYVDQYECRNESLEVYGSDRRGIVNYQFNNYGYRNDIDYESNACNVGVYIGSSLTAGIGVDWSKSFAKISSIELNSQCYQFSQGCVRLDNQEMLNILKLTLASDIQAKYYVLQFIGLDRRYNSVNASCINSDNRKEDVEMFIKTFKECEQLLTGKIWCFFASDGSNSPIPDNIINHEKCVVWNPYFVDSTGVGSHPGVKWHQAMGLLIAKNLQKQLL